MHHDPHQPRRSSASVPASRRAPRWLVLPCAIVLAVLTGAVFGQSHALLVPAAPAAGPGDEVTIAVARRYYDAVNAALQSGDVTALTAVVAPDFVDHTGPAAAPGTREDLFQAIRALAAARPESRLTTLDLITTESRTVARLRLDTGAPEDFLGLAVDSGSDRGGIEVLRVANGRVVERWASPAGITRLESPVDATVDVHALGPRVVTMVRVTLSPGAVYRVPPAVVSAILLEAGTVVVPRDEDADDPARVWREGAAGATASETVTTGQRVVLEPGDLLVPARDAAASVENDGGGAATVLLTTIVDPATADGAAMAGTEPADGVSVSVLAGGVEVTPRFGETRLLIGRATLATGAMLAPHAASDPELVFVESGALRLTAAESGIAVRRGADGTVAQTGEAVLAAGDGALVPPGALVDLRVDGPEPALLVMVRFVADDPGETDSLG